MAVGGERASELRGGSRDMWRLADWSAMGADGGPLLRERVRNLRFANFIFKIIFIYVS